MEVAVSTSSSFSSPALLALVGREAPGAPVAEENDDGEGDDDLADDAAAALAPPLPAVAAAVGAPDSGRSPTSDPGIMGASVVSLNSLVHSGAGSQLQSMTRTNAGTMRDTEAVAGALAAFHATAAGDLLDEEEEEEDDEDEEVETPVDAIVIGIDVGEVSNEASVKLAGVRDGGATAPCALATFNM